MRHSSTSVLHCSIRICHLLNTSLGELRESSGTKSCTSVIGATHLPTTNYLPSRLIRCTPSLSLRKPTSCGQTCDEMELVRKREPVWWAGQQMWESQCPLSLSALRSAASVREHLAVPTALSLNPPDQRQEHTDRAQLPELACPGRTARGRGCGPSQDRTQEAMRDICNFLKG